MATDYSVPKKAKKPINTPLLWGGGAAIAALILFFVGFFIGRSPLAAAQAEAKSAKAKTERVTGEAIAQWNTLAARTAMYIARNLVYRASVELDRRNFGEVQKNLKRAATVLEEENLKPGGFAATEIDAIKTDLKNINVEVTNDTGKQRAQLLSLAERMDKMLVPFETNYAQ